MGGRCDTALRGILVYIFAAVFNARLPICVPQRQNPSKEDISFRFTPSGAKSFLQEINPIEKVQ